MINIDYGDGVINVGTGQSYQIVHRMYVINYMPILE